MKKFLIETAVLTLQGLVEALVGYLWSLASPILKEHPAVLAAMPGLAEDRGAIYGSLAAKYSTMLYVGEASNAKDLLRSKITYAAIVLGVLGGLYVIALSSIVSNPLEPFLYFLVSRGIILVVLLPITAYLCYFAFLRGLDVDLTVVSVVTVVADLLSAIAIFLSFDVLGVPFIIAMTIITLHAISVVGIKNALKMKKEYTTSTLLASTISTLAGLSLVGGGAQGIPLLLSVAPLVMALNGSASMNFASWLGTALALGEVDASKPFNKKVLLVAIRISAEVIVATWISLVPAVMVYGIKAWEVATLATLLLRIATPLLAVVIASRSYLRGWDPDLITIPILSSTSDLVSANVLLLSYYIL
ncbi:MAG: magnesium transporter [Crenarchaeota archaeon]|nr:magnesium transporter [Thermoproteota archaeon]